MARAFLLWSYHHASPGHWSDHVFTVDVEFESPEGARFAEVFPALQRASREAAAERVREIDGALEFIEGG